MWVFGSLRMFMREAADFAGWKLSHDVVWEKQNGTGFHNDRFRRVHEYAAHFYPAGSAWRDVYKQPQFTNDARKKVVRRKERPTHMGEIAGSTYTSEDGGPRLRTSVLPFPNCHGKAKHPTQKPEELVELLLAYACPRGGVVLDPFAGSGTTGAVAERLGLDCVLIEAADAYMDVIEQRLSAAA